MEDKKTKFKGLLNEMFTTYVAKNHDYGDSFGESIREYGPIAGAAQIMHKHNRLKTLVKGESNKVGESIRDTLMDMANYCVMLVMEMDCLGLDTTPTSGKQLLTETGEKK